MKTILILLCLLMVTGVMGQARNQSDSALQSWTRYTVEKQDFSVALPVAPVLTTNRMILEGKERSEHKLEASAGAVGYGVLVYENAKPRQSFEAFIGEQTRKGLDPNSERLITVNGVVGKEFVSQDRQVIAQFFLTDHRLYRFVTSGAPAEDPRVKQFFSSIALGENAEGIKVKSEGAVVFYREDLNDVYKGKDVDRKVRVLSKPEPDFPSALAGKTGGMVILTTVFSSSGRVVNIRVLQGSPGLTEAAVEASRRIRFEPAIKDGNPVSMWMQLHYNFNF